MKLRCAIPMGFLAAVAVIATAQAAAPEVHTEDVDRFYKIYEAAHGHPTAEQLQRGYLDTGSEGL